VFQQQETEATTVRPFRVPAAGDRSNNSRSIQDFPAAGDRSYNSKSIQDSSSRRQKLQQQGNSEFQQQETEATTAGEFRVSTAGDRSYNSSSIQGSSSRRQKLQQQEHSGFQKQETEATTAGEFRVPAAGDRSYNSSSIRVPTTDQKQQSRSLLGSSSTGIQVPISRDQELQQQESAGSSGRDKQTKGNKCFDSLINH
jgi:hypothetical protein